MTFKKASLYLFMFYLLMFLFSQGLNSIRPLFEPISTAGFLLVNKSLFAIVLLAYVYGTKIHRQCGLILKANWRTLPLYWPMALIAAGTLSTGVNMDTTGSVMAVLFITVVTGIFIEELVFRGLVFYWFNQSTVRMQILISGVGFGALHLMGLFSGIEPTIILAQVYLAASFGIIFAYARARDYSIMIPLLVHFTFNMITLGAKGGVHEAAASVPTDQMVMGIMAVGTISWAWGGFLLWKAGRDQNFPILSSRLSTT